MNSGSPLPSSRDAGFGSYPKDISEPDSPGKPIVIDGPTTDQGIGEADTGKKTNQFTKLRKAASSVVKKALGIRWLHSKITELVLGSSKKESCEQKKKRNELRDRFIKEAYPCQRYKLKGRDGSALDAMAVFQNDGNRENVMPSQSEKKDQKWIIFFNMSSSTYEGNLKFVESYGKEVKANVLVFNYRGTGDSKGNPTCGEDLVQDGMRCVQFLKDQGISQRNILIHGHSIGGGIGVQVASRFQEEDNRISVISDRSFSSMQAEAKELSKAIATDMIGKKAGALIGKVAEKVIRGFNWEIDAKTSWDKIPEKHKGRIFHASDGMILPGASLDVEFSKSLVRKNQSQVKKLTPKRVVELKATFKKLNKARTLFNDLMKFSYLKPIISNNDLEKMGADDLQKIVADCKRKNRTIRYAKRSDFKEAKKLLNTIEGLLTAEKFRYHGYELTDVSAEHAKVSNMAKELLGIGGRGPVA